jgi:pyruvate/2-oxoglutarate dehydrogenase complex dihydrolipoamide dehydrogenase (E3) component
VATLPSVVVHGGTDLPQEFDVVCLGGGVAGEAIAVGLRDSGLTLAVVERELVGGECPYWGCVPSKTLLRSSETLTEAQRARLPAASRVEWTVDFPKVSKRVRSMARDLDDSRAAAAMEATGARLFRGEGKLTDLRTVDVGREQLIARVAVVIANGSTAAIPPIPRAGEIVGELVLAIKLRIPLKTLADVIHHFQPSTAYSSEARTNSLMSFTTTDGGHNE